MMGWMRKMLSVYITDENKPLCEILQISPRNRIPVTWKRKVRSVYMFSRQYPYGVQVPFYVTDNEVVIEIREQPNSFFVVYSDGSHVFDSVKPVYDDEFFHLFQVIHVKNISTNVLYENIVLEDFLDLIVWTGFRTTWLSIVYEDNMYASGPVKLQDQLFPGEKITFGVQQRIPIEQLEKLGDKDYLDVYFRITYTQTPID